MLRLVKAALIALGLTLLIWVFALLGVGSSYLVTYSHPLQSALSRGLMRLRERTQSDQAI